MSQALKAVGESTDPRIVRSRRMLMDALTKLLTEKDFDAISVQEIADEATLNRATFYLHYPDKSALLRALTDVRFRELMQKRGISFTGCNGALRAIALGVCDYLAETTSCVGQLTQVPFESSVIAVIEGMFNDGLSSHDPSPEVDPSMLAAAAAWAVFGAARRWFQTPDRVPAEEMAGRIESMVTPVFLAAQ